jgi:hypothetical protein
MQNLRNSVAAMGLVPVAVAMGLPSSSADSGVCHSADPGVTFSEAGLIHTLSSDHDALVALRNDLGLVMQQPGQPVVLFTDADSAQLVACSTAVAVVDSILPTLDRDSVYATVGRAHRVIGFGDYLVVQTVLNISPPYAQKPPRAPSFDFIFDADSVTYVTHVELTG